MLRWLLIAGLLAGCGVGVDRYMRPETSAIRQFHDYSMCGGGDGTFDTIGGPVDRCMESKGYRVKTRP